MTSPPPGRCATCGGSRAQHTGDDRCWCPGCLRRPEEDRCDAYVATEPAAPPPGGVDHPRRYVGRAHPDTAQRMAADTLPKTGTLRREIYDLIVAAAAHGMTDDECEVATARSHQTVSGGRNTLMKDGYVVDSGRRRRNRYGNDAIVWIVPDHAHAADVLL